MKKPLLKLPNKILVAALVVFGYFFVKALLVVLPAYRFQYQEPKASAGPAASPQVSLPQVVDSGQLAKLLARNSFLSALAKKAPSSAPGAAELPALGENEVRDEETGTTFKFLGTLLLDETPLAFFRRLGQVPKGELKYVLLQKGKRLSKNIRIEDVGERGVKINQAGKKSDLNVFFLEIKRLGSEKKPPQK